MSVTPEELDADRQKKAREYARIRHRLLLVDLATATAGVLIVLFSGLGTWLRNVLHPLGWQPIAGWFPWQVLLYFLALMLSYQLISAPLTYYSSYILPHRYGLSTMSLQNWLLDLLKGLALSLVFSSLCSSCRSFTSSARCPRASWRKDCWHWPNALIHACAAFSPCS